MNVINIDNFKAAQQVTIGNEQYEIGGLTVEQYLNSTHDEDIAKNTGNPKAQCRIMVKVLTEMSNIPESVLLNLDFPRLSALMMVSQGTDPTEAVENSEGNVESPKKQS